MLQLYAGGLYANANTLYLSLLSSATLAAATVLWLHTAHLEGLHRFLRIARTVPFWVVELRACLKVRAWAERFNSHAVPATDARPPRLSPLDIDYLQSRSGQTVFDFFKTLSITDVSPPVLA